MFFIFIIYFFIFLRKTRASSAGLAFAAANPYGPARPNPYSGKTFSEKRQIFASAIEDIVSMNGKREFCRNNCRRPHTHMNIRCRWTCYPPAQLAIGTDEFFAGKKKRRNIYYEGIAIEYFDGINLREWLGAQSQGLSEEQRANVVHTDHVKRAYERAKRALLNMWKKGWVHRHMNVDHFRYKSDTDDIRITATNYEFVTKRSVIPTLNWMELICEDFKDFAITFLLAVLSPERGFVHAPSLSLQSEASVITQTILEELDPEIQLVQTFLEKDASERSVEDIPASLRAFASSPSSSKSLLPNQMPESHVASSFVETSIGFPRIFVFFLMLIYCWQRTCRFGPATLEKQLLECEEI